MRRSWCIAVASWCIARLAIASLMQEWLDAEVPLIKDRLSLRGSLRGACAVLRLKSGSVLRIDADWLLRAALSGWSAPYSAVPTILIDIGQGS